MAEKKRVLFVCLGNICRSPVGEAVLRREVEKRGIDDLVEIDSAGTIDYHVGELPDPRMREAAGRRGYALNSRARQFMRQDLEKFDMIIAMDRDNHSDILKLDPYERFAHKVHLLCDFVSDCDMRDVPDPYYGGRHGFDHVISLIESAVDSILDNLLEEAAEEPELTA